MKTNHTRLVALCGLFPAAPAFAQQVPIAGATTKTGYQGHFGTSPLSNHA